MNILSVDNITKAYTEEPLFEETSFFLQEGEKVGIIGINGTGKTTLLRMIAGVEEPDKGTVTVANNMVVRYLLQHPEFEEDETLLESVLRSHDSKVNNEWEVESEAKSMLTKLGMTDFDQPVKTLSGGQKKKAALVAALIYPADILILDEPTNHLDNAMADYLEEYLKNYKGSLIMVTHDRYFLDSVTNRIVEIDKGKIYSYQTNYSGFLELKAEREDMLTASDRKKKSILRTELEWIKRGARARSTKQKARIERYEELKNTKSFKGDSQVEISSASTRLGRTTVEIEGITKGFGDRMLINDFSYIFLKDDRVGFIGPNGCGKTTLMKMLAGRIMPDSGKITVGQTVKIGYYTQEIQNDKSEGIAYMDPKLKVIDYIRETAEYVQTKEGSVSASVMLERFLFPPLKQYGFIEKLSGGEKRRLNLLRVLMEAPNVLILDEPTNDLDITTLTILEDYIDDFDGIVIIVSHDRYFLDRTVRRIFAFDGNGHIMQSEGGYSDYALRMEFENAPEVTVKAVPKDNADTKSKKYNEGNTKRKLKFSYNEEREYACIEDQVEELENLIDEINGKIADCACDFIKLNELIKNKEQTEQLLEERMERWMYLEDMAQKMKD